MKFLYKLFSIFLFFVILFFIKQIARDLSKNFENFEKSEKLENSQKSRKSVKESEITNHEDIIVKKPGFVSEDAGDKKSEAIPETSELASLAEPASLSPSCQLLRPRPEICNSQNI